MKRIDSGKRNTDTAASSNGTTPPTMNTLRHPNAGMMAAATRPPAAAPSVKPQNMPLSSKARYRVGTDSDSNVVAIGVAAPSPTPVRKRQTVNEVSDSAYPQIQLKMPKASTDAINTGLRPSLSAQGPAASAPMAMPIKEALSTGPSASFATPHSLVSEGRTKPMAAVSKPSATMMRKQTPKTSHWRAEKPRLSMNCCTSSVPAGSMGLRLMVNFSKV